MKKLFFVILVLCSLDTTAQKAPKPDSIYYLLDIAKVGTTGCQLDTLSNEGDKIYIVTCPVSNYKPGLNFLRRDTVKGLIMGPEKLKRIKLSDFKELMQKAEEQIKPGYKGKHAFFFFEPASGHLIRYRVFAVAFRKPEELINIESIRKDTAKNR